jgi:hypothetical protein
MIYVHLINLKSTAPNVFLNIVQVIDIFGRNRVKELVDYINQTNLKVDCNYCGLHLLFKISIIT